MDGLESGIQVGELDDRAIPLALPTSLRGRDGTRQPAREHSIPSFLCAVFLAVQWHFLSTHLPVSCLREIGSERKGGSRGGGTLVHGDDGRTLSPGCCTRRPSLFTTLSLHTYCRWTETRDEGREMAGRKLRNYKNSVPTLAGSGVAIRICPMRELDTIQGHGDGEGGPEKERSGRESIRFRSFARAVRRARNHEDSVSSSKP